MRMKKQMLLKEWNLSRDENTNTLRLIEWAREDVTRKEAWIARRKREEAGEDEPWTFVGPGYSD
jgi:hypothetical protein